MITFYNGSIVEAVSASKAKNAIFVVYVEGTDDGGKELVPTLSDSRISTRLNTSEDFLVIKLVSGSEHYTHFAQIYQFVPVPCLYFIGHNGTPLEVVCPGVGSDDLAARIDKLLLQHRAENGAPIKCTATPSTSSTNVKSVTQSLLNSEAQAGTSGTSTLQGPDRAKTQIASAGPTPSKVLKVDEQYEIVCEGDVCVRRPIQAGESAEQPVDMDLGSNEAEPVPTSEPSPEKTEQVKAIPSPVSASVSAPVPAPVPAPALDEKLERAKELLELKRKAKIEEEKRLEREKELERRAQGQGVAELKRWQQEQELKQIQEDRKREKLESMQARQRVLDQIAQDRAERKARTEPATSPTNTTATPATTTQVSGTGSGEGVSSCRIQFRLGDGTSHSETFSADDTLATLRDYVGEQLQYTPGFALWTSFPRRELLQSEDTSNLSSLGLSPSAALLVFGRRVANAAPNVGDPERAVDTVTFTQRLVLIYEIFVGIFSSMVMDPARSAWAWVTGNPAPPPRATSRSARGTRSTGGTTGTAARPGTQSIGSARYRPSSNIHRLTGDRPDDDNNTWNGNSTQQM